MFVLSRKIGTLISITSFSLYQSITILNVLFISLYMKNKTLLILYDYTSIWTLNCSYTLYWLYLTLSIRISSYTVICKLIYLLENFQTVEFVEFNDTYIFNTSSFYKIKYQIIYFWYNKNIFFFSCMVSIQSTKVEIRSVSQLFTPGTIFFFLIEFAFYK